MKTEHAGIYYVMMGLILFFLIPWIAHTSLYRWIMEHSIQIYTYGGRLLGGLTCLAGFVMVIKGLVGKAKERRE